MNMQEPAAPAAIVPGKQGELRLRVISALVLAISILVTTWAGGLPFRIVWSVVGGLVLYEWLTMMGRPFAAAALMGVALSALALVGGFHPDIQWAGLAVLTFAGLGMAGPGLRVLGVAAVPYAAVIAIIPSMLRDVPWYGMALIIWTFAVVWFTDIAAYFTGRALGGPKLAPRFSPNKTWSGAIGGAIAGTACGALVWWGLIQIVGLRPPVSLGTVIIVSLVASALGQVGDIAESAFKRRFKVKDSSQLIPGHGGFMDRLDAYWAVLAFAGLLMLVSRVSG
jgi:phosphatidate cytidylyltransferase